MNTRRTKLGIRSILVAGLVAGVGLLSVSHEELGSRAEAQSDDIACADLSNPVYIAGASAVQALIEQAQRALNDVGADLTLVYQKVGSCEGPPALIGGTEITATPSYYVFEDDSNPTKATGRACSLPASGVKPDISVADVTAATCGRNLGGGAEYTLGERHLEIGGAIQAMTFAVPATSSETAISAEAARVVFGFAAEDHTVAPWLVGGNIFHRKPTSGTQILAAAAIGLNSNLWASEHQLGGNGDVVAALKAATDKNSAIGLLASSAADKERGEIRILAFQSEGQACGYLPDSSATSFDKVNVREGRYGIFGPMQFLVNVNEAKLPVKISANADEHVRTAVDFLTLSDELDEASQLIMLEAAVKASVIPPCAMKVQRADEYADPVSYEPEAACHCFFEVNAGVANHGCVACESDADCGGDTPSCNFGYCEKR